jgi:hypothetical protein
VFDVEHLGDGCAKGCHCRTSFYDSKKLRKNSPRIDSIVIRFWCCGVDSQWTQLIPYHTPN